MPPGLSARCARWPAFTASAREPRSFIGSWYAFSTKACISQEAQDGEGLSDSRGSPITIDRRRGVGKKAHSPLGYYVTDGANLAERQLARTLQSSFGDKPVHLTRHVERHYIEAAPLRQLDGDAPTLDIAREMMVAFIQKLREMPPKEALANVRLECLGQAC